MSEFEIVALPETFNYFGQSFSHIYVNENGFLTFGNSGTNKPWDDFSFGSGSSYPYSGGGRPIQYLNHAEAYDGGSSSTLNYKPDGYAFPDVYGKPGTSHEGNLDNTIFALWNDFITDADNTDWSIRQLWNSATKILTIGWYNIRSYNNTNNNREANFEVQLNFTDDSFRIVHGNFGDKFPGAGENNVFVGASKDVSCATSTGDISMCEGKDYIQLYFHDNHFGRYETPSNTFNSFQQKQGAGARSINGLYNSYFTNNQTVNGTEYCFNNTTNLSDTSCSNTYSGYNQAKGGTHFVFNPQGGGGSTKNVLLPSNIKQSYRSGHTTEFIWMHLDKDPTTLTYTPPANNATGFEDGANARDGFIGGSLSAGSAINHTTATDEIVIGGEVYTASKLETFLNNTKKVVAYAPIPLLHTNKYELAQYAGQSDVRFRRAHTIMPNFISTDYMESKDNGTDANFDFHQLRDDDHCKGNFSCIVYNTDGSTSFNAQDGSSNTKTEAHIDGMYAYAAKALDHNTHVHSNRFGNPMFWAEYVPVGQSLWYQVFNPTGRGVGLFAQLNWSCGTGKPCGESSPNKSGAPHNSQHSLFSVLIADAGDKSDFATSNTSTAGYAVSSTGTVIDGSHYWSYKRRDGRTTSTDGAYAGAEKSSQITFGINPIACVSGPDNGCFFGDNQGAGSSTIGAPSTAIITTSDPCSSGQATSFTGCHIETSGSPKNMELGVMYSMAANDSATLADQKYKTETFYQGIAQQKQYDGSTQTYVDATNLAGSNSWRTGIINTQSANTWHGRFSGHWMTDVESTQKSMPMYFRAPLTATFDATNDRVKVIASDINIYADEDWNTNTSVGDNTWYHSGGCSHEAVSWSASSCSATESVIRFQGNTGATLQFGDDDNQKETANFANSAYINKKVFGAILKNESKNIHYSNSAASFESRNVDNAGAMVTWDTIDEKDKDWLSTCSNNAGTNCQYSSSSTPEPSLEYMSWGIWAMATNDGLEYMAGEQPSAVHMGTWYAGDLLDASDWPVSRTANLAGMAMFSMWKSETVGGVTTNYNWTEGSRADGSVVFDGSGNYGVTINVHDLGRTNCDNGASSGNVCSSGAGNSATAFSQGAMGTITWTGQGSNGHPNFNSNMNMSAIVQNGVSTYKDIKGSLYGTSSHIEVGAELLYSKQDANNYLQAIGTAILSE
jgi:hypothetical protein